jgi:hypothetical protein
METAVPPEAWVAGLYGTATDRVKRGGGMKSPEPNGPNDQKQLEPDPVRLDFPVRVTTTSSQDEIWSILQYVAVDTVLRDRETLLDPPPSVQMERRGKGFIEFNVAVWRVRNLATRRDFLAKFYASLYRALRERGISVAGAAEI